MGSGLCSMLKELPWSRPCENRSMKVMRFRRRVYVKEIVEEYPNHGIFDAGSVKRLGTDHVLTRPLDHNSELQPGKPYYVTPLSSAGSSFEELKQISSYPEIISTSVMDGNRVLRVKLRMRKNDVPSFLSSNKIKVAENFVMKESPSLALSLHGCKSGSGFTSEWKPSLNTIAEINSHQAGN